MQLKIARMIPAKPPTRGHALPWALWSSGSAAWCSLSKWMVPLAMRQIFTYDQGPELVRHAEITQKTGTAIYFAVPHSP
jgi:hypothetical protein